MTTTNAPRNHIPVQPPSPSPPPDYQGSMPSLTASRLALKVVLASGGNVSAGNDIYGLAMPGRHPRGRTRRRVARANHSIHCSSSMSIRTRLHQGPDQCVNAMPSGQPCSGAFGLMVASGSPTFSAVRSHPWATMRWSLQGHSEEIGPPN